MPQSKSGPQNAARIDCYILGSPIDDAFSQALAEWTAFYALMGGAAATLLGLLFVAVSVRLNIFHQHEVADVRDFAAFTFGTFLVAIAVAGFAIAPHAHRFSLASGFA